MRSDNLQLPHITSNFLMVTMVTVIMVVMVVMVVMLVIVVMVVRTGQDRTKLTFKLDFPGNL